MATGQDVHLMAHVNADRYSSLDSCLGTGLLRPLLLSQEDGRRQSSRFPIVNGCLHSEPTCNCADQVASMVNSESARPPAREEAQLLVQPGEIF